MLPINDSQKLALFSGSFHAIRMLIGALQALYLLDTGVTLSNLAFLKAYFALLVLIFDVPFGMFGDSISHKKCIYFSCFFVALYYLFSLNSPNMIFLIIAESCYAIGLCFISGAFESLLIFSVRRDYQSDDSKISYFYFLSSEVMSVGSMLAAPIGVLIFILTGNMRSIYFLSLFLMLIMPLLIYSIDESELYEKENKKTFSKDLIKSVFYEKSHLVYIAVSSMLVVAYQPIYHFWQPLFIKLSKDFSLYFVHGKNENHAVILAFVFFAYSFTNYVANRIAKKKVAIKNYSTKILLVISIFLLSLILLMMFMPEERLILFVAAFSSLHGLMTIFSNLTKSVLISYAEKQKIATVVSFSNVFGRILSTLLLFLCSLLIDNSTLQHVFSITFISMLLATFFYLNNHPERRAQHVSASTDRYTNA